LPYPSAYDDRLNNYKQTPSKKLEFCQGLLHKIKLKDTSGEFADVKYEKVDGVSALHLFKAYEFAPFAFYSCKYLAVLDLNVNVEVIPPSFCEGCDRLTHIGFYDSNDFPDLYKQKYGKGDERYPDDLDLSIYAK
jgi:hypothetical protein